MGNSKRSSTIYKPKKGRRVTAKKLYKVPQRGGGFLETFLGGNPDLDATEGSDSDGEEKDGEGSDDEGSEDEGSKDEGNGEESGSDGEGSEDEGEGKEEEDEGEKKGILSTAIASAKNTASELQTAFTTPINKDTSADAEDISISEMSPTPEAAETETQETLEVLRMKNIALLEKVNILHETIVKLQEEKITSLQGSTPLEQSSTNDEEYGTTPIITEDPTDPFGTSEEASDPMSIVTPEEEQTEMGVSHTDDSAETEVDTSDPMSIETPGGEQMDISPVDASAQMYISPVGDSAQMDVVTPEKQQMELGAPLKSTEAEQLGGTKHRRNKHRRTKRKRKGSKK